MMTVVFIVGVLFGALGLTIYEIACSIFKKKAPPRAVVPPASQNILTVPVGYSIDTSKLVPQIPPTPEIPAVPTPLVRPITNYKPRSTKPATAQKSKPKSKKQKK